MPRSAAPASRCWVFSARHRKLEASEAEAVAKALCEARQQHAGHRRRLPRRDLRRCVRWRAPSMDAGAAGVMIAPPPHLRTDEQIIGYFKQAVEAIGSDIPWVLQDYPLTLSVIFTPAVIRKIVMGQPVLRDAQA